jgi:DNA-binding LytR/AlgR family response regulator
MNLNTYIVDDEPHAIELLQKYIGMTPGLFLLGSTLDAQAALQTLQGPVPPHIVFLDIDMPVLSGITVSGYCQAGTLTVFTTSFREYGPEAFEKNALDYLLKPFSYERFLNCIDKAQKTFAERGMAGGPLFVKGGARNTLVKIDPNELVYIEGAENFVYLHKPNERITTYQTLQEMAAALPPDRFLRIHKSYIVNLDHIASIEPGRVRMDNQVTLPLGRVYTVSFQRAISTRILQRRQ